MQIVQFILYSMCKRTVQYELRNTYSNQYFHLLFPCKFILQLMSSFGKAFSKKKSREQSDVVSLATASCSKMGARATTPAPSITGIF